MNNNTRVKTILILAANPTSTSRLRLDEEVREIDEGLRRANKREEFKLEQKWAVRSRDFYRAILDYQPQIVHFCGHGAGKDGIVLDDETGQPALISADALGSMFKLFATKGVDCVLLNACYSLVQAEAISQHVNYVIGMTQTVGDKAAVAFAVAFYDAIAAGEEVEFAYDLGCSQMIGFLEQQTPVLKKKALITLPTAPQIEVIPPNPYQGLSAFGEDDAAFFFGRETFVNDLIEATHKQPLVAVIGPSGSGKSSVVFAGLIPQLRGEGNWLIESFRPGNQPFYQLASALVRQLVPEVGEIQQLQSAAGLATNIQQGKVTLQQVASRIRERNPDKRFLLFADQFEELYTLCQKEEQERFADMLLQAIHHQSITLVFTLRADFYGYVLSYRPLRDALQEFTPQLVSSMSREELIAAIALPAQKLEVQLEAQLQERILDDVGLEPGNLPLLEFALTRLWSKQQNRMLTHQSYNEIGGVKKALANHAEQIYRQLSETEQKQAQRIFVQLVRPGEGTEDTRRLATRKEVGEENWGLVSYLAGYQARLVVTGRDDKSGLDTVEVVHEALIREWITLREWMNANRQFRVWQERLKVAMLEWENDNHDSGGLLRGVPLAVAEDWLHKRASEMTQEERDFIQASATQRDREKQERDRRRRLTIVALGSFSAVALILAGVAVVNWRSAAISEINSLTITSDALLNSNGRKALKASLKAVEKMQYTRWVDVDTHTQVELTLLNTVDNVVAPNTLGGHAKAVFGVSFSPDGKMLATASGDYTVKLWDTATLKEIKTLYGHTDSVMGVSFSPDGKMLATASFDGTVKLWNIATLKEINTLTTRGRNAAMGVSFSPDGKMLATANGDKTVRLWDTATLKEIKTLYGHTDWVNNVSFSPDGKMLASTSNDGTVKLWDAATLKEIKTFSGHRSWVYGVSFSPNGKMLASASRDYTVKLWDTVTGQEIKTLTGHRSWVRAVSFSPNGKMLVTASYDGTVKLWDTATLKEIKTLSGHTNSVNSVSFSPDGKMLASASDDNTVKLWDTATGQEINTLTGHTSRVNSVSFSPDGKMLASASDDNTVKLWDTPTGQKIKTLSGHRSWVYGVSFSPNGKMLATASFDGTVKLWDTDTGQVINTLKHTNAILGVSFSPNGKMLATASGDHTVKLWNTDTGQEIKTLIGHTNVVRGVSFSPNGKMLASASDDNTVKLWNTATYQEIKTLYGHTNWVYGVSFSPDGKMLASASYDNTVKLWDTDTGQVIKTLIRHESWVGGVSFSPDGKMLASASADKMVKLWDTATGQEIKTLSGHTRRVNSVSFSPDGKMLASASDDSMVKLWRWDFNYLLREGCVFIREYFKTNPNDADADIDSMCDRLPNR